MSARCVRIQRATIEKRRYRFANDTNDFGTGYLMAQCYFSFIFIYMYYRYIHINVFCCCCGLFLFIIIGISQQHIFRSTIFFSLSQKFTLEWRSNIVKIVPNSIVNGFCVFCSVFCMVLIGRVFIHNLIKAVCISCVRRVIYPEGYR